MYKNILPSHIDYNHSPETIIPYYENGEWFMGLYYKLPTDDGKIISLVIPKVGLGKFWIKQFDHIQYDVGTLDDFYIDLGSAEFPVYLCYLPEAKREGIFFLKDMKRTMTLKQIEEELGYEVDLIEEESEYD